MVVDTPKNGINAVDSLRMPLQKLPDPCLVKVIGKSKRRYRNWPIRSPKCYGRTASPHEAMKQVVGGNRAAAGQSVEVQPGSLGSLRRRREIR